MFRVGQKVVCVDAANGLVGEDKFSRRLERGNIYTIRGFCPPDGWSTAPGVYLDEIAGMTHAIGIEYGFRASRFRPVVERKTDISILKALLVPGAKILEGVE